MRPAIRNICQHLNIKSKGNLQNRLAVMRDRGLITFDHGRARSIRIIGQFEDVSQMQTPELRLLFERVRVELRRRDQ